MVYLPLDKDIIREMWVQGDLKDQLGLSHRRARKGKNISDINLEAAPMFANIHIRSLSDSHNYEPAMADSPPYVASTGQAVYLDTPPMSDIIELPPHEPGVQYAQPTTNASDLHSSSPTKTATPSPQLSYYSVTDIAMLSPLPSPKFQLPSGEITSTPPSQKPTSRTTSIQESTPSSIPTSPPSHSLSPDSSAIPATKMYGKRTAGYPGEYEMQTYEPVYGHETERNSQASYASFATADDLWTGEEGVSSPDYAYQHRQMLHTMPPLQQESSQPHVVSQADEDDRSTIVADSRRGSVSTVWEGARAL
jgi:phospholipid-translocating ATPase